MGKSKYGNFLTVILIIVIVAILGLIGFGVYKMIKGNSDRAISAKTYEEFEENANQTEDEEDEDYEQEEIEDRIDGGSGATIKKTYNKDGFIVEGYITIPKINISNMEILDKETPAALESSVALRYKNSSGLNQPGNVVIAGHNYRNGKFFSNLKKVSVGDTIRIKDTSLTELTYTVYSVFETTPEDTSFYTRNTDGAIEVTLSTCTDDSKARIIVLARVEE